MSLRSSLKDITSHKILLFAVIAITVTRLINAIVLPPIQDEMYYFYWATFLDWGYFDHPPLVSWISSAVAKLPSSFLAARAGTVILGILSIPLLASLFRELGLKEGEPFAMAMLLALGSLVGILFGYLTTPDIPMIFCWIAALHECAKALGSQPKRWLTAGLFTGLGILGKYTMVLIGPIFLFALLFHPRKLRSPWPYLGGLVCLLVLLPHISWLSQNDWITTRFQFGRGLMSQYGVEMQQGHDLPPATAALDSSEQARLASFFVLPADRAKPSKPKPTGLLKAWRGLGDYLGGQLAIWGLLLFPILIGLYRGRRRPNLAKAGWTWTSRSHGALMISAAVFPVLLFLPLSTIQHIEANWPAMYCIGAAALIVRYAYLSIGLVVLAVVSNLALSLLITYHSVNPLDLTERGKDRLLRETHGYKELAEVLKELPPAPIFADTYQNVSAVKFYAADLKIQQWPGIARTSEIQRRPEMNPWQMKDVKAAGGFFVIMDNFRPPYIPGATIDSLTEIMDCPDRGAVLSKVNLGGLYQRPCQDSIHRWSLAYYTFEVE